MKQRVIFLQMLPILSRFFFFRDIFFLFPPFLNAKGGKANRRMGNVYFFRYSPFWCRVESPLAPFFPPFPAAFFFFESFSDSLGYGPPPLGSQLLLNFGMPYSPYLLLVLFSPPVITFSLGFFPQDGGIRSTPRASLPLQFFSILPPLRKFSNHSS